MCVCEWFVSAAGFLIVEYGYWATFALAGALRLVSALILLSVFGVKEHRLPVL